MVGEEGVVLKAQLNVASFTNTSDLRGVALTDASTAWVISNTTIWRTSDAGDTWGSAFNYATLGISSADHLEAIDFADSSDGWVVGKNSTIVHIDASADKFTWQGLGTDTYFRDVHAVSGSSAWAVGDGGAIVSYSDTAAQPWQSQTSETSADLRGVHFVDENTGWAVGADGTILKTTNGGW
jgi:photosystem II stability/assembly factor-like uncharacterized protein